MQQTIGVEAAVYRSQLRVMLHRTVSTNPPEATAVVAQAACIQAAA
jgi:hypothetical protein